MPVAIHLWLLTHEHHHWASLSLLNAKPQFLWLINTTSTQSAFSDWTDKKTLFFFFSQFFTGMVCHGISCLVLPPAAACRPFAMSHSSRAIMWQGLIPRNWVSCFCFLPWPHRAAPLGLRPQSRGGRAMSCQEPSTKRWGFSARFVVSKISVHSRHVEPACKQDNLLERFRLRDDSSCGWCFRHWDGFCTVVSFTQ